MYAKFVLSLMFIGVLLAAWYNRSRIGFNYSRNVGQDSLVGIVIHYELDSPGIKSWWGLNFPHLSNPASLLYNGYRVFPEGKAAGA
jgi:hypothetical protein